MADATAPTAAQSGRTTSPWPTLAEAIRSAPRVFWCNTNRDADNAGTALEQRMHDRGFAAAWVTFNYTEHMLRVRRGDLIFAYANGVGVVGIGVALESRVEILAPDHPGRLRGYEPSCHEEEWRTPVAWLVWNDTNPCVVETLRSSFQEITHLQDRVAPVTAHFLNQGG